MRRLMGIATGLALLTGVDRPASAQTGTNAELYHVQFVKAAPGKLAAAIEAYLKVPADKNNPEPPLVFRHVDGDDWHLMIIQALGKDETVPAVDTDSTTQQWVQSMRGVTVRHGDTFTVGPPLADVKKVLAGDPAAVYVVTAFEPVPGHREQLATVLQSAASTDAPSVVLQHREGAPWQLLSITRYASWAAFGSAREKAGPNPPVGATNEHVAAHHDTLVLRVTAPPR